MHPKLNREERIEAKQLIRECVISRFTRKETLAYISQRLKRKDLSLYNLDMLRMAMKRETIAWLNSMIIDRWAYASTYRERIDEYHYYKKEYLRLYRKNEGNAYMQKVILDSLQNCSAALCQLYDVMPEICSGHIGDAINTETRIIPESPNTGPPGQHTGAGGDQGRHLPSSIQN